MNRLKTKIALVTGGASGIGRATALLFAREGAAVAVADLDGVGGREVVQQIEGEGGRALFVRCDVTVAADCASAVRSAVESLGGLDALVLCAGIIRRANVLATTEVEWDRVMAVNVKSAFLMCRYAIPVMVGNPLQGAGRGGGAIVTLGSGWGLVGGRDAVAYCASKAAVVNMTRALALDHGAQGIRVNCICPGDTDTPMLRSEAGQLRMEEEAFLAQAAERPLARIGRPEEVAEAALYLASDAASFVTGAVLVVDGGGLAG